MTEVVPLTGLDLRCTGGGWPFAAANREAIDRHWANMMAANPKLWNGRSLICTAAAVEQGTLRAELVEIDYASFVAWYDWGRPDASVVNCFGVPAVFTTCGALVLGEMAGTTLNAGRLYPPSGTLEPRDVRPDGSVDILGSMHTEFREETGIDLSDATPGPMAAIFEGSRVAVVRRYDLALSFEQVVSRFAAYAASDPDAELAGLHALRHSSETDSRMIPYVAELMRYFQG